jgi:uncharacterized membrane protein YidH (DUF202 family)
MLVILDPLLIVHFIGLMLGAAGGMGGGIAAGFARTLPAEKAAVVKELTPRLTQISLIGLALMIGSGVALVFVKYNGDFGLMPVMFWIKLGFVLVLTVAASLMMATYGEIRRGNAKAEVRLQVLGPISGMSAMAAVVFAVLAFH